MDVREKLVGLVHTIYNDPRMEFHDLYGAEAWSVAFGWAVQRVFGKPADHAQNLLP